GLWIIELLFANSPAHNRLKGLGPPAIKFGQIYSAAHEHLHATGATRLPRPSRVVNPDIHAVHHLLGEQHVIVRQENCMRTHLGAATNEVRPLTNQSLTGLISRMSLTRNQNLYRTMRVCQEAHQPLWILQQ